jgi:hypothetical protein
MIQLNSKRANEDFLNYLALAPGEELRQLNLTSIDVFVCTEILQHMANNELPVTHSHFDHLFYFAISRNTALSDMARKVIENAMPSHAQHLAFLLSKLPPWAQIAYVDNTKSSTNTSVKLFLTELKKVSVQKDVRDEIDEIIR